MTTTRESEFELAYKIRILTEVGINMASDGYGSGYGIAGEYGFSSPRGAGEGWNLHTALEWNTELWRIQKNEQEK